MADPLPIHDLTHVATVNALACEWGGVPHPSDIQVHAGPNGVVFAAPGDVTIGLTADEAVELADALAEASATARNLARDRDREAPMVAHARQVVEACLGIRWPG